jgi:hypothetical protein
LRAARPAARCACFASAMVIQNTSLHLWGKKLEKYTKSTAHFYTNIINTSDKKSKPFGEKRIEAAAAFCYDYLTAVSVMQAELKLFDNRPITLYLQLQRPRSRNVANKKEPGLQVR